MKSAFLALFSGLLYCGGFVGFVHPAMAWFALVPLLFAVHGTTPRQAFVLGWLTGYVAHLGGFYWVVHTMMVFGAVPWPIALLLHIVLALAQSMQFGLFGIVLVTLHRRSRASRLMLVPISWVVAEFVFPQLFPSYFANSQYTFLPIVQIAEVTGVLGISFLLALVNAAIFLVLQRIRDERKIAWMPLVMSGSAFLLVFAYGIMRIPLVDDAVRHAPKLKIGLVQENLGLEDTSHDLQLALRRHIEGSRPLEEQGVDLLVWPETAVKEPSIPVDVTELPREFLAPLHTPVLSGFFVNVPDASPPIDYNAALLIDADRKILGGYRKQVLLMFGEYIPFGEWFPSLYDKFPNIGRLTPAQSAAPIQWGEKSLGITICYEGILPRLVQRLMFSEPHLLVNLTNDSWFGDTREPLIHLALTTFRTVEHRRALVRSTNTGISAFIDPVGRIIARTNQYERATLVHDVPLLTGRTVYGVCGDWVGWLSVVAVLFFMRRRPRPRT